MTIQNNKIKKVDFKSEHNLPFEVSSWIVPDFTRFRVGTCDGLFRSCDKSYDILAISNSNVGNGHFNDVLQWFENSCKRDNKNLQILEVWNSNLKAHLINKRGFNDIGNDNVIKTFN